MTRTALAACLVLMGCDLAPRTQAHFRAHPEEAEAALNECARDARHGEECRNAEIGLIEAKRDKRMEMFRRGFEK